MATIFRRSTLFLLSALGVGCGDAGTMGAFDGASTVLDDATSENGRHAEACSHAGSLAAMLADVARHESAMNDLMGRMAAANDEMRTDRMESHPCAQQGMAHMSQEVTDTSAEVAVHTKQMRGADTVGAGHYECADHAHELGKMLARMRDDLGSMACTPQ
ncbi:MAG TPA: hypothetical protein VNN72_26335 [Polyangiaceae bacterium]|nr:hypothetical protein [Polyangiaceae bacterium]